MNKETKGVWQNGQFLFLRSAFTMFAYGAHRDKDGNVVIADGLESSITLSPKQACSFATAIRKLALNKAPVTQNW